MTTSGRSTRPSRVPTRPAPRPPHGPLRRAAGIGLAAVVLLAAAWWWWPRDTRLAATTQLQQDVLSASLRGRARRQAVDQIIRNADTMGREQLQQLRDSLLAIWRQLEEDSLAAFAAAPREARATILDRDLDRHAVWRELQFAISWRDERRNRSRETKAESVEVDPARQQLEAMYRKALAERAKERGVTLARVSSTPTASSRSGRR
jgi:hypothetical protein